MRIDVATARIEVQGAMGIAHTNPYVGDFYLLTLSPGPHSMQVTGIASSQYGSNTMSAAKKIDAEADTNYLFELAAALGMLSINPITNIEQGKKDVMGEKRAESMVQ
jgi:hypothetical protein